MDNVHEELKVKFFKNAKIWWMLTAVYFGYVTVGGVNWKLHRQLYTGDDEKSILHNLKKGQIATFRKKVYAEFFFPSFLRYHITYRFHVMMAGLWLVTGVYNLRNQPTFNHIKDGKPVYDANILHTRISGYLYLVSSLIKGLTASLMSWRSHSLGFARWPMIAFGMYDVLSLIIAYIKIVKGDFKGHKAWMIRNFAVGSGSIWVRVFGGIWAIFDLSFMKDNDFYRKMNNIILCTGFTMGPLFGEYWLAETKKARDTTLVLMLGCCVATLMGARSLYEEKQTEQQMFQNNNVVQVQGNK